MLSFSAFPGVKIIFRVALVLLRHTLGSVEKLRSCQGMYETMEQLRNLPQQCMQEDFLVHEVGHRPRRPKATAAQGHSTCFCLPPPSPSPSPASCYPVLLRLGDHPPSDGSTD